MAVKGIAIRHGRWKLLLDEAQQPVALFDLETDPLELRDIARDHPERVSEMAQAFRTRMQAIEADPLRPKL